MMSVLCAMCKEKSVVLLSEEKLDIFPQRKVQEDEIGNKLLCFYSFEKDTGVTAMATFYLKIYFSTFCQ